MTALGLKIIAILFAVCGLFFLGIGVYISDSICLIIGVLLICATLLVIPEIKRNHRHPFR